MIDWVTASVPFNWAKPICGGHLFWCSPDGSVERQTVLSAHCRGSFDEHLTLRTVQRGFVEFDGNPSKFVQGHNLCGSNDLRGLVLAALVKALALVDQDLSEFDRARVLAGDWAPSRVDLTESFELDSRSDVLSWLRAASELARMRWRARGTVEGSSLYFGKVKRGKRASPWSLKAYCKAQELEAAGKGHALHADLPLRDELLAWVQNKLRVEVLLRGAELRRFRGGRFAKASEWNEGTAASIFEAYFGKLELGTNVVLSMEEIDNLKPAVRLAYTAWRSGHDLQGVLPSKTFYRYRRQLLDMTDGQIDLRVPAVDRANTVPIRRVLELRPVGIPEFLHERADLLFRRVA